VLGVLEGFGIIAVVILAGYLVGRSNLLGPGAGEALGRLAFFVLAPPLLFTLLARADLAVLFGVHLPIAAISAFAMFAVFLVVALRVWHRKVPEALIGALASGYQNSNNIGLPLSLYILGNAVASAPIIMMQVAVLSPIALAILDVTTGKHASRTRTLLSPLINPLVVASVLGVVCALCHWLPPAVVMAPLDLVGAAAVPILLISFGMSLAGGRVLPPGPYRKDVLLAAALKLIAMPVLAWAVARFGFGLTGPDLYAATVLAALPAAQNVFNYAQRYARGLEIARDAVFITTIGSIASLLVITLLLGS